MSGLYDVGVVVLTLKYCFFYTLRYCGFVIAGKTCQTICDYCSM